MRSSCNVDESMKAERELDRSFVFDASSKTVVTKTQYKPG